MKKLMITAAAAMTAMVGFSIESSNVVGYQSTAASADTFYMIANQFDDVTGTGAGIALKDMITGAIPYGAQIQVLNSKGGYDIFTYLEEAYDESIDDFVPGWGDVGENLAMIKVAPGTSFWFKAPVAVNGTIAGQVLSDVSKTIETAASAYTMVGNPYPAPVNPNAVSMTGVAYGDTIQVLNSKGGYDIFTYLEEAYDESIDDFVPGWGDVGENLVADAIIPAGQGAWMLTAGKTELEFSNPVK